MIVNKLFSAFPYIGGKFYMLKKLYPLFPKHHHYVEPFCGSCVVLLNKSKSKVEIVNDVDKEIYNFFNVVKNKHDDFYESFKYTFASRVRYNLLFNIDPSTLDDVQRAHRFYYIVRHAYNNIPKFRMFRTSRNAKLGINYDKLREHIDKIYDRIKNVIVECLDYRDVIKKYDAANNFFFIDPPYYDPVTKDGHKPEYVHALTKDDFKILANRCKKIKGKFLMTINNHQYIRDTFSDFNIKPIQHAYNSARSTPSDAQVTELLISNYPLEAKSYLLHRR